MTRPFVKVFTLANGEQVLFRIVIDNGDYSITSVIMHPYKDLFLSSSEPFEDYEAAKSWLDSRSDCDAESFYQSLNKLVTENENDDFKDHPFFKWYEIFADALRNSHRYNEPIDMDDAKDAFYDNASPTEYASEYLSNRMKV